MQNAWEEEQLNRLYLQATELVVPRTNPRTKGSWRRWKRAVENLFSHFPQFVKLLTLRRYKGDTLIAAMVSGGVGDLLRFNAFFRTLVQQYPNVKIDIYTAHSASKFIFSKLPGVRAIVQERLYPWFENRYDACLDMGQIVIPSFKTDVFPLPQLKKVSNEWTQIVNNQLQRYHRVFFPQIIKVAEQHHWNFLEMLGRTGGIVGVGHAVPLLPSVAYKNPFAGKKYITFNTGWNKNDKFAPGVTRHTKCWPKESWREWVHLFRTQYPDIEVIQLGESNSPRIEEANTTLLGRTTLPQVTAVLKDSLLHVDCDCGLMHVSYALGVRGVMLFGPTNGRYLAYSTHVSILSPRCGNCWHLTSTWDQRCPLYPQPVCMSSISPQLVQEAVVQLLAHR